MTKNTKINRSDLKFYPSERLTDHDDAGGLALGTAIKGEANEIFDPISNIDRVNGGFNMRKIFAGLQRADDEKLIGANIAITKPPADPSVSYLLFRADKFGEVRGDGVKRIESFINATIESSMTLLSNPAKGSKIVQAYQRLTDTPPQVGDIYCLHQDKQGYSLFMQYIQIVRIESAERKFSDGEREFVRRVLKLEITQPLAYDFIGVDYPSSSYAISPTKIRETHVADAGSYYGVKPLAAAVQSGLSTIKVNSIMDKIVPTASLESISSDLPASRNTPILFDASRQKIQINGLVNLSEPKVYTLPAFMPGSLDFFGLTDNNGQLIYDGQVVGEIDYINGAITQTKSISKGPYGGVHIKLASVSYTLSDSLSLPIDVNNRSYNHALTLINVGAGSVNVSYLSQGKWYELKDDGQGKLVGVSKNHGSGAINYKTGALTITCGELPDVDSYIIINWGNQKQLNNKSGNTTKAFITYTLSRDAITNSIRINIAGRQAQVGNDGKLTGSLTGSYDKNTRTLHIDANNLNQHDTATQITYNTGTYSERTFDGATGSDTQATLKLSNSALTQGSVELKFSVRVYDNPKNIDLSRTFGGGEHIDTIAVHLFDDGNGVLKDSGGANIGTIDYAQATVSFNKQIKVSLSRPSYEYYEHRYKKDDNTYVIAPKAIFNGVQASQYDAVYDDKTVHAYFLDAEKGNEVNDSFEARALNIDLSLESNETIVPSSVVLSMGNNTYLDKNGTLYTDVSINQSGRAIGKIDYVAGIATIQNWHSTSNITLISLATSFDRLTVDSVSFRTPTSPIRPNSLQITAVTQKGVRINATANAKGEIKGDNLMGHVDVKHGVVDVRFGNWVDVASVQDEPWFRQELAVDGRVWRSVHVLADSIKFNAISVSHLPIDSNHIKIDTARLPQDGRIPIFRRGDTILIGNRQITDIGSAFTAGQTISLPRQNLDRICVMDSTDKPVLANLWDYDLDAGTITFATPLNLSEYQMPLKVMHAKEEKNVILGVDIDGTLTLRFPLRHSYDTQNSFVSGVLIAGNLAVRATVPFTQANWDNVWRDEAHGSSLLNRLNVKDYPIILTDDGAITERWLIKFKSANQFELYGENLGFVLKTDTLQNLAPINPATQKPYFTVDKRAFGNDAPWAAQDVIRFNTEGTLVPLWIVRAVQPSNAKQHDEDGFSICLFGDTTEV